MNEDRSQVKLPKGATYKDQEILKVMSRTIGEKSSEDGYMILLGDGTQHFLSDRQFEKLIAGEEEADGSDTE